MTTNVIDAAATEKGSSATPGGGGERALMVLVATREARDLRTRAAQESTSRTSDLIDLDRALARLSPVTRAVVWLYDVEGWSHEEIARAFDRTLSFSKSQLARGHARLRTELVAPATAALGVSLGSDFDA